MKKYSFIALFLALPLVLSGCSVAPGGGKVSNYSNPDTKKGSIWKSSDGGATFEPKINIEEAAVVPANASKKPAPPKQITAADILTITFNPNDSNIIYVGTRNNAIFKTVNGGETWTQITFPPQQIYSFLVDRSNPENIFFASGALYGVGKIFRTDDGGQNWKEVYSEPGNGTLVISMAQYDVDSNIILAGTSKGTVIKSTDGGQTWRNVGQNVDGPVTEIQFDVKFGTAKNFSVYALTSGKKLYYSSNGGDVWTDWETAKKEEIRALQTRRTQLVKDKKLKEADSVAKAIDDLNAKNQIGRTPANIVSLTASPVTSGLIYVGTQSGSLYRSSDSGKYWEQLNLIESANAFPIRMVAVSHINRNELAFVAGTAFYKSLDAGATWSITQLNVDRPVSVIAYDPKNGSNIYLGLSAK